ncbi:MAG: energy-coupling factor transporter ATPase [Bacillota bacterium]|nr:energy-coupling factor transporter ATPase [Clostridia bacterium]
MNLISVRKLSYIYKSPKEEIKALDNVNLEIKKGEWLAVIGPNGSGKSTLAKHFNALLIPTIGSVIVDGKDTSDPQLIPKIRQKVAFVFQNPDNQLVATTVEEDIAFGPENLGIEPGEIVKRVRDALRVTGMEEYQKAAPHLLSGGQKQRVAIAGALAMQPEYLVMDEATAMLDPQGRKEVLATLSRLNKELGLTVIYITHFMEEAALAHRIAVMNNGQILFIGIPRDVFSRVKELEAIGLDVPDIAVIASELREKGLIKQKGIITIDELVNVLCQLN